MLTLVTFGALRIESDGDATAPHLRRSWLALLAIVAASGEHGIARDRLIALLWPESDEEHARQSARQALYSLRLEMGREVVRTSGALLSLEPAAIRSDVAAFKAAIAAGDRTSAVALSREPFLEGFHLPNAPTFQRWAEEERARIAGMRSSALVALASDASRAGRTDEAVEWWQELTEADPLNGRYAVGYLKALAARGDRAQALAFARKHETLIRRELEVDPDPEVRRLEGELRAMEGVARLAVTAAARPPLVATSSADGPTLEAAAVPVSTGLPSPAAASWGRRWLLLMTGASLAVAAAALFVRRDEPAATAEVSPIFAVGLVQEVAIPESARVGRILTDMLATNLARIEGLRVLSNSRLLQLVQPGVDTALAYAEAARRAGATELLEGHLVARPEGLVLELRRVELRGGLVRDAFTVVAKDRFQLVDSISVAVARRFRLASPRSSVATTTTRSAVAYRLYEEGLRAYHQDDAASARRLMRAALTEDSTFAMAAHYEAILARSAGDRTPDGRHASVARQTALRLAARAPDRERLTITANVLVDDFDPRAVAVAESLATRYPDEPETHRTLGRVRSTAGDWAGAVAALERAVALDSAAGLTPGACHVCDDLNQLADVYLWFDSLDAAVRTARRQLAIRDGGRAPLYTLAIAEARRGDSAAALAWFQRLMATGTPDLAAKLNLDLRLEHYEAFDRHLPQLLWAARDEDAVNARWYYLISLRNQGRLREAESVLRSGRLPGARRPLASGPSDLVHEAILALARGDGRSAARTFASMRPPDSLVWSPGHVARQRAWSGTLVGMARASVGDTAGLRALADSVEMWGSRSLYGRDRRAHHFLRGLLHVARGADEEGVREFREAIHSPSLGFTRVNVEMARALLRLGRYADAVAVLQPALRGELDASNLYVTRTELHELLAEAFEREGNRDSATAHHRAVLRAWQRADEEFAARRERAARGGRSGPASRR